jgi:hypothetical protein
LVQQQTGYGGYSGSWFSEVKRKRLGFIRANEKQIAEIFAEVKSWKKDFIY